MSNFINFVQRLRNRIEQSVASAFPVTADAVPLGDVAKPARWGRRALWIGALTVVVWAAFAPLSEGVPVHGVIKVEGNRKTIQHLRGGIVEEILVQEGDQVQANQPLIRLNETQLQAQQGMVESQLVSLWATEARLKAERVSAPKIAFPDSLTDKKSDPRVMDAILVQTQLFQTRRASLDGEIAIATETITGLEQQIQGLLAQERSKAEQLKLYQEELADLKPMYEQGFVPRNRMFELERAIAYLSGQYSEGLANLGRARSQVAELRLRILSARNAMRKEVETQLTEVQSKVADFTERRVATSDDLERVVLRAPLAGTVVDLSVHTLGGVIGPGQKLMDIVPTEGALVIEVQIPPHLIDNVHSGQDADVHFLAMDQTIVPAIPGSLLYISADRITDPRNDNSYFVGRVQLTPEGFKKLGKHMMQAGMPADVVIKTGERTFLGYLLKPVLSRMQFAFTER